MILFQTDNPENTAKIECRKSEENIFFPKDSYLGVLRLFLRVLVEARSRRLGIAGEVSVWQIPENSVNHARVNTAARFCWPQHFFFAQDFGRAFSLWEKRPMIDLPIRSLSARIFARKNLDGRFPYGKNDQ